MLVCDMCGTLVEYEDTNSSWEKLNDILNIDQERNKKLTKKWKSNDKYSFIEYTHDTVKLYLKKGIKKEDIDKLKQESSYKNGIDKLLKYAKKQNMYTMIITGGIGNIAEMLYNEFNFDTYHSSCYFNFYKNDLVNYNIERCGGASDKISILNYHLKQNEINIDDVIFVGDDLNDYDISSASGTSFDIGEGKIDSDYSISSLSEIPEKLE